MTDDEARALGLRWVKAGLQATYRPESMPDRSYRDVLGVLWRIDAAMWPDVRDDATRGVLLGQVIRAMNADPRQPLQFDTWADLAAELGSLEPEALVDALERGQG